MPGASVVGWVRREAPQPTVCRASGGFRCAQPTLRAMTGQIPGEIGADYRRIGGGCKARPGGRIPSDRLKFRRLEQGLAALEVGRDIAGEILGAAGDGLLAELRETAGLGDLGGRRIDGAV